MTALLTRLEAECGRLILDSGPVTSCGLRLLGMNGAGQHVKRIRTKIGAQGVPVSRAKGEPAGYRGTPILRAAVARAATYWANVDGLDPPPARVAVRKPSPASLAERAKAEAMGNRIVAYWESRGETVTFETVRDGFDPKTGCELWTIRTEGVPLAVRKVAA